MTLSTHQCTLFSHYYTSPTPAPFPLSLHDALPICMRRRLMPLLRVRRMDTSSSMAPLTEDISTKVMPSSQKSEPGRSEEHTSELQSRPHLVCRLLLEKKKKKKNYLLSITVMSYQNK